MHFSLKAVACLPALSAVLAATVASSDLSPFLNKTDATGTPALLTHAWTGEVNTETATLYGNSVNDIVNQIYHADPTADKTALAAAVSAGLTLAAMDKGKPEDLPDIGVPNMPWKGVGGPYTDYNNSVIAYDYSCGDYATADEAMARQGAHKLRNMPGEIAFTPKGTCARHWCKDTTAMFVCNEEAEDVVIPKYNVGWMAERLHELCCDDNGGKSGQMWHYKDKYSVVLGYANCNEDPETNQPYAYGLGNNQLCRGASPGIW